MSVTITPFLRHVLRADALISGAAGLLMAVGAPYLAPFLGLALRPAVLGRRGAVPVRSVAGCGLGPQAKFRG